jgi:hypothetical protein
LFGGIFPDKFDTVKLPSAEISVNFNPVVVPSVSTVKSALPVLSDIFIFPVSINSIISPLAP